MALSFCNTLLDPPLSQVLPGSVAASQFPVPLGFPLRQVSLFSPQIPQRSRTAALDLWGLCKLLGHQQDSLLDSPLHRNSSTSLAVGPPFTHLLEPTVWGPHLMSVDPSMTSILYMNDVSYTSKCPNLPVSLSPSSWNRETKYINKILYKSSYYQGPGSPKSWEPVPIPSH